MSARIPITQFLRPNAEKRFVSAEVSDEAGARWEKELAPLGLRFTAEVMPPNQVCICLDNPEVGADYRVSIVSNTPGTKNRAIEEVEAMILGFDASDYQNWLSEQKENE